MDCNSLSEEIEIIRIASLIEVVGYPLTETDQEHKIYNHISFMSISSYSCCSIGQSVWKAKVSFI